jgi:hypothetical protein
MFSTELLQLLECAGENVESWRERLKQNVAWLHSKIGRQEYGITSEGFCFTDAYLAQLKISVDNIRRIIKNE